MALKIRDGGTLRTITNLYIKQAGVLRRVRKLQVKDGGTLRTVATFTDPLTASASPSSVSGSGGGVDGATVGTTSTTAMPSGGRGPYTYSWALTTNGGGNASQALNPTSATTQFTKTDRPAGTSVSDVWTVTITDTDGQTATAQVTAFFQNISVGGVS